MSLKGLWCASIALTAITFPRLASSQADPIPGLDRYVSEAMRVWQVPGVAIAIVRNDTVLLSRGYGVLETGRPGRVDDGTIFAIASLTKSFTAATAGILVDRGLMGWDTLAKTLLPDFRLRDPWVTDHLTLRDMLVHRTGLTGGDWLRLSGQYDRAEVLRRMRFLDFDAGFRARYLYHNLMYLAAGEAVAARAGKSWDAFVKETIFVPLRMLRTNTSICELRTIGNAAVPHELANGKPVAVPRLNLDNGAPHGSINASVSDMANWLRMQLGDGEFEGKRILSSASLAEMHRIQISIPVRPATVARYPGARFLGYGMGWLVQDYRGAKLLRHSGWIDGFRSEAALLPEKRIGIVILTNRGNQGSANDLPDALRNWILDRILAAESFDWSRSLLATAETNARAGEEERKKQYSSRRPASNPTVSLSAYSGTYADSLYGHAIVKLTDGRLTLWLGPRHLARLEHWEGDKFMARWENPAYGEQLVSFTIADRQATQMETSDIVLDRKSNQTTTAQYSSPSVACAR